MAEAPAERTFCRLYRKLLGPCMRHRLTSMYLLWSQEVRGPWELNLGPSLLASSAKLLCLSRYGKLGWCQEAVSAFMGAPKFRGTYLPYQPHYHTFCFCLSPSRSNLQARGSFSLILTLCPPSTESQLMPGCPSGKRIFLVQGRIQGPALPRFGSTHVEGRNKEMWKILSQGNSLAHATALLLQSPVECQVLNIPLSFSLMFLCSRPVSA